MAGIELDVAEYFQCLADTENDLYHILSTFVESEHEIVNFCDSRYIELSDITSIIKDDGKDFTILSLNIQSINAKFDNFDPVWTIYRQWACISGPFVFRRPGFHLMLMYHYYLFPAIN